jgi:hypothetical protein
MQSRNYFYYVSTILPRPFFGVFDLGRLFDCEVEKSGCVPGVLRSQALHRHIDQRSDGRTGVLDLVDGGQSLVPEPSRVQLDGDADTHIVLMRYRGRYLARLIEFSFRRFSERDPLEALGPQARFFDRIGELERVVVVVKLGAFVCNHDQQAVAIVRVVDRVRKLGREIDITFREVRGDDGKHRFRMAVDAFYSFREVGRTRDQIGLGVLYGDEVF